MASALLRVITLSTRFSPDTHRDMCHYAAERNLLDSSI